MGRRPDRRRALAGQEDERNDEDDKNGEMGRQAVAVSHGGPILAHTGRSETAFPASAAVQLFRLFPFHRLGPGEDELSDAVAAIEAIGMLGWPGICSRERGDVEAGLAYVGWREIGCDVRSFLQKRGSRSPVTEHGPA